MARERLETNIITKKEADIIFFFVKSLKLPKENNDRLINILKHCIGLANLYYNYSLELEKEIHQKHSFNEAHEMIARAFEKS